VTFQNETGDDKKLIITGENVTIFNGTNLSIVKFSSKNIVSPGDRFNYTINVTNLGPGIAIDVTVFELFNENLTFISSDPVNTSINDWNLGNFSPGELKQLNITVEVNASFTEGVLKNIINVTFINGTGGLENKTIVGNNVSVEIVAIVGFSITLPGVLPVNVSNSTATNATVDIEFNASGSTDFDVEPCVIGVGGCQNATDPIFLFQNTGTVNLSWTVFLNTSLPSSIFLQGNTVRNGTTATNITTAPFTFNSSIAPGEIVTGFLFADFINAIVADSTIRRLTHNGSAIP